jgi:hypothetical protein
MQLGIILDRKCINMQDTEHEHFEANQKVLQSKLNLNFKSKKLNLRK